MKPDDDAKDDDEAHPRRSRRRSRSKRKDGTVEQPLVNDDDDLEDVLAAPQPGGPDGPSGGPPPPPRTTTTSSSNTPSTSKPATPSPSPGVTSADSTNQIPQLQPRRLLPKIFTIDPRSGLIEILGGDDALKSKVHVFSSLFYKKLDERKMQKKDLRGNDPAAHTRVQKWARRIDVSVFDYLVFPIAEHLHWSLATISATPASLPRWNWQSPTSPPSSTSATTSPAMTTTTTTTKRRIAMTPSRASSSLAPWRCIRPRCL